ncbi:dendrin isoform X1 [Gallus gallus]|uniref:dendrin isoform X1 n=1 Tax=Gallus gallus TaxID=9031 RepID=UPI001AEA2CBC|nr:dendrin isoform X1 [Gallus gallus]
MLGGAERGVGRLRICERTQMLLVEIRAVTPCCSPTAAMAAGCRPASPWGYQRFAGAYTFLEKRIVAELTPPRPRVVPPQDFTSHPSRLRPLPVEPHYGPPPGAAPTGGSPLRPINGSQAGPPQLRDPHAESAGGPPAPGGAAPIRLPPRLQRSAPHPAPPPGPEAAQPPPQTPRPWGCAGGLQPYAAPRRHRGGVPMAPWDAAPPGNNGTPPALPDPSPHRSPPPQTRRAQWGPAGVGGARPHRRHARGGPGSLSHPPAAPSRARGRVGGPGGGPPPRRPALYSQALREAVSRIRRHTAPDSDSDAEGGAGGGRQRPCRDVSAYSSSSSLESLGGAPPGTASPIRA